MTKYLIIALILIPCQANADSLDVLYGSITEHFVAPRGTAPFRTKLGDDGKLIYNPTYGLRYIHNLKDRYISIVGFTGDNSVGETMTGGYLSYGTSWLSEIVSAGFVIGAYDQKVTETNPTSLYDKVLNSGVTPIIGFELDLKLNLYKNSFVKLHNIITPILSTSSATLGVSF